jgi:site-specific recombinase XerD
MPKCSEPKPLGDHAEKYLALLESLGRVMASKESCFRLFEHWLVEAGIQGIDDITPEVLARWRTAMAARLHPNTAQHRLSEIRRFFLFLYSRGILRSNPAAALPHESVPRTPPFVFTVEAVKRLLTEGVAAIRFEHPGGLREYAQMTAYTLFHLLYATGMRRSEVLQLRVRDFDVLAGTLAIRKTKFHKERTIPLGARAAHNLRAYLAERRSRQGELLAADPVFVAPRNKGRPPGPMDGACAWTFFHQMLVATGFRKPDQVMRVAAGDRPHIHSLRHAFAVHRLLKWYRDGADLTHKLFLLSAYMGHRGPDETAVYLRSTEAVLAEAKGRLDQYLLPLR